MLMHKIGGGEEKVKKKCYDKARTKSLLSSLPRCAAVVMLAAVAGNFRLSGAGGLALGNCLILSAC